MLAKFLMQYLLGFHPLSLRLPPTETPSASRDLQKTAIFYTLAFLLTNVSFSIASASFTETIKAAEPLTSTPIAVMFGVDTVSAREVAAIGVIVVGVLVTVWEEGGGDIAPTATPAATSAAITLSANLCLSLRGAYQTRVKRAAGGGELGVTDLELFTRISSFGFLACGSMWALQSIWAPPEPAFFPMTVILVVVNAAAHNAYNLASTVVLSRVSLIHHAALNCLRRLFSIVVTSVFFEIQITLGIVAGVTLTLAGFACFSASKSSKRTREEEASATKAEEGAGALARGLV
ncbi:hypothetical protein TeGR_g6193 [Tetraparma gracilis]|uniref:Sugar phosphate transporter domain-containing protein n=1 Tax=Tetraparma gracilis TaxID=2962635 RepID=A0ABQ6M9B2_9STRA|nr:hypothetical protein TeGR_g6193 [Tetraparma gracilis]